DCGEVCDKAQALLNRRGVPFRVVDVKDAKGFEQLKKVSGDSQIPVLQAGDKLIARGFSETRWQALLDDAGYPKTPPPRRPQQSLAVGKDAAKIAAPDPSAATPPASAPGPAPAGNQGGGYPKL